MGYDISKSEVWGSRHDEAEIFSITCKSCLHVQISRWSVGTHSQWSQGGWLPGVVLLLFEGRWTGCHRSSKLQVSATIGLSRRLCVFTIEHFLDHRIRWWIQKFQKIAFYKLFQHRTRKRRSMGPRVRSHFFVFHIWGAYVLRAHSSVVEERGD